MPDTWTISGGAMDTRTIRVFSITAVLIAAFILLGDTAAAQARSRYANASATATFRVRKSSVDLPDRVGGQAQSATTSNVEEVSEEKSADEAALAATDKRGVTVSSTGTPSRQSAGIQASDAGKLRPSLKNAIAFVNN